MGGKKRPEGPHRAGGRIRRTGAKRKTPQGLRRTAAGLAGSAAHLAVPDRLKQRRRAVARRHCQPAVQPPLIRNGTPDGVGGSGEATGLRDPAADVVGEGSRPHPSRPFFDRSMAGRAPAIDPGWPSPFRLGSERSGRARSRGVSPRARRKLYRNQAGLNTRSRERSRFSGRSSPVSALMLCRYARLIRSTSFDRGPPRAVAEQAKIAAIDELVRAQNQAPDLKPHRVRSRPPFRGDAIRPVQFDSDLTLTEARRGQIMRAEH